MILVFDCDAHILIDPGDTHSFISMGFISNVNVELIRAIVGVSESTKFIS